MILRHLLCLGLWTASGWAGAVEEVELTAGLLAGGGWRASGVTSELRLTADGRLGLRIRAEVLRIEALQRTWQGVLVECGQAVFDATELRCDQGLLRLSDDPQAPSIGLRLRQRFDQGALELGLIPPGAKAPLRLTIGTSAKGWHLEAAGQGLPLESLAQLLGASARLRGRLDLQAELTGDGDGLRQAKWRAGIAQGALEAAAGGYVAEGLAGELSGSANRTSSGVTASIRLGLNGGELLTPFAYLSAAAHPLRLAAEVQVGADHRWTLGPAELGLGKVLQLRGGAKGNAGGALESFELALPETPLGPVYSQLLQPVLATTALEQVGVSGSVRLELKGDAQGIRQGAITLEGAELEDRRQPEAAAFALQGVNGLLRWGDGEISRLAWAGGQLLGGLALGAAELRFRLDPQGAQLIEPARLPLLDGELVMEELSAAFGAAGPALALGGYLTPISMPAFSGAMGWPPLQGQLSGMIPRIRYEDDRIGVDGVLLFRLFDGEAVVRDLRLQTPFGTFPRLEADLEIRNLDLETLTRAFAFGKITGRVDGRVSELVLEQWRPVAFDARFATPAGDPGPHRISQRAVENLSNLGGAGLSGALSRNLLRLFDEFGYGRLGFRCRLRDGVCDMEGIEPAQQGYYLVKGSGIPRIDILGFNRRIDWNQLLAKLKQIAAGGEPVIQ